MQKLKVCRKLMAFVLTLCMVLPLISNQYLVVRAEEPDEAVNAKSYQDVDILQIGQNNKLKWVEGETVTYPISSTENATWNGKVVHIAGLEKGSSYTLKFIRSDSDSETDSIDLDLKSDAYMLFADYMFEKMEMDIHLDDNNKENYWYLSGATDYWLNITTIENTYPTEDELKQLTVQVTKNKEFTDDEIQEVTGEETETVKASDYMIGSYKGVEIMGKMYKITLKSCERIKLSSKASDDYSLSFDVKKVEDGKWADYCEGVAENGYLTNKTDKDATYYVSSGFMGILSEFTVSFGAKETITVVDIGKAEVTSCVAEQSMDLSAEKEQSLRYGKLLYRYLTKEESNIQTTVTTAHWAKLVVPQGSVYQISIPLENCGLLKYDSAWGVYEQIGYEFAKTDDCQKRIGAVSEGTYYIYSEDDATADITVKNLQDVSTIKDSAVDISDSDVKAGVVSTTNNKTDYYKYCDAVYDGKESYDGSRGVLYKIIVPTGKSYLLLPADSGQAIVYDDSFKFIRNDGNVENTGSTQKTFYVWHTIGNDQSESKLQIRSVDATLENEKTKATILKIDSPVTYQYSNKDDTYYSRLSYLYYNSTNLIENAKVYKVEPGIYTLDITSDNTSTTAELYYFETDDLHLRPYSLLPNDCTAGYCTTLDLSTEKQVPIRLLNTGYLVMSGDAAHPDAKITLTLKKGKDERLSENTKLIKEIYNGYDNAYSDDNAIYTVVNKREGYNEYGELGGIWYKYNLDAYTKVDIEVPLCGDMYVYKNPEEPVIYHTESYGGTDTYHYENDMATPCTLYICLQNNPSYTLPTDKIRVDATSLACGISAEMTSAIEINGAFTTSNKAVKTVMVPESKDEEGRLETKREEGKLYKLTVDSKNKTEITYDKNVQLAVFDDLNDLPIVKNRQKVEFSNLSKESKTYYLWITGDNADGSGTVSTSPLTKEEKENTVETVVPVSNNTTVTISEEKTSNSATIKTEAKDNTGISADAIKESIKIAEQYNSDNAANVSAGKAKVTSIQTTYTDDTKATITRDVVAELQKMDTKVDLEVSKVTAEKKIEYAWKMKAASIGSMSDTDLQDINTKVTVAARASKQEDEKKLESLVKEDTTKQVVEFAHEGKLPANTEVTVSVGNQFTPNQTIYYYHFNKAEDRLDYAGKSVVTTEGYVTLTIDHCSDYVLCNNNVCAHQTEIKNAKEATCTMTGYTGDKVCKICKETVEKGTTISAKGHTAGEWEVKKAATTTDTGIQIKKCTVCGVEVAEKVIPKLPTPDPTPVETPDVAVRYTTHVQSIGWQGDENNADMWFVNGKMAGTSGRAKRLEGIKIRVYGNDKLGIQYTTHCQSYGWLPWSANGEMNGTEGEAKRLEAIKIQLTGADKEKYDVYYRVHAQSYGWLGWAKNGEPAGTAGYAKRLEGIQIVVVKKDTAAPGLNYAGVNAASGVHQTKTYIAKAGSSPVVGNTATSNENPKIAGDTTVNVAYRTHVQSFGWQGWKYNGQMSGTSGKAKRLEGINIKLTNKPYSGSIVYTTHVQSFGWQGDEHNQNTWMHDGQMAGTSGKAKRLEAIRINLTGEMAKHYDIYYRVHAQSFGWMNWTKNGEPAGTAGLAKRLEGIQIVIVPKGGASPAANYGGAVTRNQQSYIKK